MKNKFRIIATVLCLALIASFMVACKNSDTEKVETTNKVEATEEVTTVATNTIDEAEAKAIALEDAGIQESAAKDLTVKLENNTYVITFVWSGFDYQYTIDATNGKIVESIFDGEVTS